MKTCQSQRGRLLLAALLCFLSATSYAAAFSVDDAASRAEGPLAMLDLLAKEHKEGNVAFSPLSVWTALAITAQAADGKTSKEIERQIGLPIRHVDAVPNDLQVAGTPLEGALTNANALWLPHDETSSSVDASFDPKPFKVDFKAMPAEPKEAARLINGWVSEATGKLIPTLVTEDIDTGAFIITNALYFKSAWLYPFDKENTREADFHAKDEAPAKVPMMHRESTLDYWEQDDLQAVRLPFKVPDLDYVVFMSKSRRPADAVLQAVVEAHGRLFGAPGADAEPFSRRAVRLGLPRHRIEFSTELRTALEAMGIKTAFTPCADFSNLMRTDVHVDSVRHRAVMIVNEEGAEAAAATAVITTRSAQVREEPLEFIVDRPFVAFIMRRGSNVPVMSTIVRRPETKL